MSIIIREFAKEDTPGLSMLMNHFEDYYAQLKKPPRPSKPPIFGKLFISALLKSVQAKQGKVFVACEKDRMVGFVAGVIGDQEETDRIAEGENKPGFLLELFVEEDCRKFGVGSKLVEQLEKYFKQQFCTRVFLEVDSRNQSVMKFYNKIGYDEKRITLKKIFKYFLISRRSASGCP